MFLFLFICILFMPLQAIFFQESELPIDVLRCFALVCREFHSFIVPILQQRFTFK